MQSGRNKDRPQPHPGFPLRMTASSRDSWLDRASRLFESGKLTQAERLARKALKSSPTAASNLLAGVALKRGDLASAQKYLARALHASPKSTALRLNLIHIARRAGNTATANKHLDIITEQSSNDAGALLNLASLYAELGRHDEALSVLERSFELRPTAEAMAALALMHAKMGNFREALPNALSAIAKGAGTANLNFIVGRAYLEDNKNARAEKSFQHALSIEPNHQDALIGLSISQARQKDVIAAKSTTRRALQKHPYFTSLVGTPELRVVVLQSLWGGYFQSKKFGRSAYVFGNYPANLACSGVRFDHVPVDLTREDQAFDFHEIDIVLNNIVNGTHLGTKIALNSAVRACDLLNADVVNRPENAALTTRQRSHDMFCDSKHYIFPTTKTYSVIGADRSSLAQNILADIGVPVIIRPSVTQMGKGAKLCRTEDEVLTHLNSWNSGDICAIRYFNCSDELGNARQYRIVALDGVLYPERINVAPFWHSHDASREDIGWYENGYDELEQHYLSDPRSAIGVEPSEIFQPFVDKIGLEIFGIDFGIDDQGRIIIFEANASMNLFNKRFNEYCPYKVNSCQEFEDNVKEYLMKRAGK